MMWICQGSVTEMVLARRGFLLAIACAGLVGCEMPPGNTNCRLVRVQGSEGTPLQRRCFPGPREEEDDR